MTFYTTIIWMFYASRTYFKHFKKNVFLFKRISSILTPHYKKDEIWRQEKTTVSNAACAEGFG